MTVDSVRPVSTHGYLFGVDRGGTFTDIVAWLPDGRITATKVLSSQEGIAEDAAIIGIREILQENGEDLSDWERIDAVRMGTTVGTNALLEHTGEPVALLVSIGLRDVLRIGYQNRPRLFDLNIILPDALYETVVEVDERVTHEGEVVCPLDPDAVRTQLADLRSRGFRSCAVAFMHSYRYPEHEKAVADLAYAAGFEHVAMSHDCSGLIKYVARTDTAVVDANLTPLLRRYVGGLQQSLGKVPLKFMQSNGGLIDATEFRGKDCVLSGPAGGIVGAVDTCRAAGFERIIGFDMGGTSTDVTHYAGEFERNMETEIAGARIRVPAMAIHTVAAGGGSILTVDGLRFRAGPESAGAFPGPVCYRNGGPLTVTDCNVQLGRIDPKFFPKIFGPERDQTLDAAATRAAFEELAASLSAEGDEAKSANDCAEGFLKVAVENMANAIKKISVQRGYDLKKYTLCSFGGAGGQHACAVADALNIPRVFIHPLAGVLSAYGMGVADMRQISQESVERPLEPAAFDELEARFGALEETAVAGLVGQGLLRENIRVERRMTLRYAGSNVGLDIAIDTLEGAHQAYLDAYLARYGFTIPDKGVIVESQSVEAIGLAGARFAAQEAGSDAVPAEPIDHTEIYLDGAVREVPVFLHEELVTGQVIEGPAMIIDPGATTVVDPGWESSVLAEGSLLLARSGAQINPQVPADKADPVYLEVFNNRFMAIAEHMGHALMNTAHSVNIKERLDFSCAVFDRHAKLVANAPHIPIHLGAMSESVETILRENCETMKPGDVFVLNSPYRGGAHLPDITVIAPVFDRDGSDIIFFTAARGHHADVGGTTPGSMPPDSTSILDEGALIEPTLLVDGFTFLEDKIRDILLSARYPARNPDQNIADLRAQVAACLRGADELKALCDEFGTDVAVAYSGFVQDAAEVEVRRVLSELKDGEFTYHHDLGFQVTVAIKVDRENGRAVVDFTGTSDQVPLNFNAPPCIARSAVLYVLRCLVQKDISLNEGCLRPVDIIIPEGSLLNPRYPAAVTAGNPETSCLITDTLFGALRIQGACQGTMNNVTFGDAQYQYYETVCGGSGAGPTYDGTSAVHTTMTNSLMTDPEVLELRFPVRLEQFHVHHDSGGKGLHRGGDGVVRRLKFLHPFELSLITNRRVVPPYGMNGGEPGSCGRNVVYRADGTVHPMTSCDRTEVLPGDVLEVQTPGGGGYGTPEDGSA